MEKGKFWKGGCVKRNEVVIVISGGNCPACKVIPCMFRMVSLSLRDAIVSAIENIVVLPMFILALCVVAVERSEAGLRSVIAHIVVKWEKASVKEQTYCSGKVSVAGRAIVVR